MVFLPEPALVQHPVNPRHRLLQTTQQRFQEPFQPVGNIQRGLLAGFQCLVVTGAIFEDAGRHCIKSNGLVLTLGQGQVSDSTRQPSIAVIERMQGDEPEVRYASAYNGSSSG